ncbi:50S ribosomal protein L25 [Chloroflexota bacterium]
MEEIELLANTREVLGKKVRFLRREGNTPVHLFGHSVASEALQCDTAELRRVLTQAGRTGLISLKIDNKKGPRNVVVREVQRAPRSGALLHVDFYQVRMTEKIRVEVPIVPVGEAPALKEKDNFMAQELNNLTIECLPNQIPNDVELDVSSLTEADQTMHVADITLDEGITILNDPEQMVLKIGARRVEKVEEGVEAAEEALAPEVAASSQEEPGEESSAAS